jgi:hypothetical protein
MLKMRCEGLKRESEMQGLQYSHPYPQSRVIFTRYVAWTTHSTVKVRKTSATGNPARFIYCIQLTASA